MKSFYVYKIIDPRDNTSFYVGKGIGNRINQHLTPYNLKMEHPLYNMINEILSEGLNPIFKKMKENLSENNAFNLEREIIEKIGLKNLTNKTNGGGGCFGNIPSEETRQKMSDAHKGRFVSEKTRRKISKAVKGFKHSKETKHKMGKSQKKRFEKSENHPHFGKNFSEEHRKKISKALKGKTISEETRKRMSLSQKKRQERLIEE